MADTTWEAHTILTCTS